MFWKREGEDRHGKRPWNRNKERGAKGIRAVVDKGYDTENRKKKEDEGEGGVGDWGQGGG